MRAVSLAMIATCAGVLAGALTTSPAIGQDTSVSAQSNSQFEKWEAHRINRGFAIAPVPLKYSQQNKDLVGLAATW